ncbi:unnamed protein product [Malus baccata var. baccata]
MLKELQVVRMSASLIKIAYDERHRGAVTSQQHNSVIVTEVLDQKFGRRHGKFVRCTGKAGVRETGASSSRLSIGEVNSLKEEVTTLRGQVAAQGDHIRAQDERMNMIVQALAMSGLQIPTMPAPNVAPPSTSQPFCPDDTE